MIEIFVIVTLYKKLKKILLEKGRHTSFAFLGPVFWIIGEFSTAFICGMIAALVGFELENELWLYLMMLLGAIVGALIAYVIVRLMPTITLECPFCSWELPKDTKRRYSYVTCMSCDKELKVLSSIVSEYNR